MHDHLASFGNRTVAHILFIDLAFYTEISRCKNGQEGKSKQAEIDKLNDNITNATVISEIAGVVKSINNDDSSAGAYSGDNSDNSFLTVLATGNFQCDACLLVF